jgi:tetrahydromethanopterin S-methyltransferase subunit E
MKQYPWLMKIVFNHLHRANNSPQAKTNTCVEDGLVAFATNGNASLPSADFVFFFCATLVTAAADVSLAIAATSKHTFLTAIITLQQPVIRKWIMKHLSPSNFSISISILPVHILSTVKLAQPHPRPTALLSTKATRFTAALRRRSESNATCALMRIISLLDEF